MHLKVGWQGLGGLGHEGPHELDIRGQSSGPLQRKVDVEEVHNTPAQSFPRAQINVMLDAERQVHAPASHHNSLQYTVPSI